jgi:Zn-dependent alcohol dehydrogenase
VYGLNDWFADGAQVEYCVAPAAWLAPKPQGLDHVQTAVVPISALTAWQALFERAGLRAGQRVLIHGAAGSVGSFAVQLARWRGAHVIGTASAQHLPGAGLCIRHQWEPQPFYDIWSKMGDVEWYATEVTGTEWHIWVRRTPR